MLCNVDGPAQGQAMLEDKQGNEMPSKRVRSDATCMAQHKGKIQEQCAESKMGSGSVRVRYDPRGFNKTRSG